MTATINTVITDGRPVAIAAPQPADQSPCGATRRSRRVFALRATKLIVLLVTASAILVGGANPSQAAVRAGDGNADENVYCNSATHQVRITTWSNGILSNQIGGSDLFPYYLPYPVYLRIQKIVNGQTVIYTNWIRVSDGTHSYTVSSPAGQTSYWAFHWAFMTPSGSWAWANEWAGGFAPYGWYSDQRGYRSLTSCHT